MCFSASASFGASLVLGTIGIATLAKVKNPVLAPFASIPIMFAVQQLSEGALWISLSDSSHASWSHFPIYIFLIFAQIIWPVWVPFSVLLLERSRIRRRILMVLMWMGLSISSYLLYCLFVYDVSAEISKGHIHYILNFPIAKVWVSSVLYFMPTVISLFVSSIRRMVYLGTATLLSFLITNIFFEEYLISVWCFFAAILSLFVLRIIYGFNRQIMKGKTFTA